MRAQQKLRRKKKHEGKETEGEKKKKKGGQGSTQQEGAPNLSLSMSFFYQIVLILWYIYMCAYILFDDILIFLNIWAEKHNPL
jgi:hypothetical protein